MASRKKTPVDRGPLWERLARDEFGLTDDPREAAYVFTDGDMLDFSEKRNGGPGGSRPLDHRAIERVMVDDVDPEPNAAGDRTRRMRRFMEATGAVRVQLDDSMVRVDRRAAPLTGAQIRTIVRAWSQLGRPTTVIVAHSDGEFIEEDVFSEAQARELLTKPIVRENPLAVRPQWVAAVERAWGVHVRARFGGGAYGVVFDIGNNHALKITKGPQEGIATNLIRKFQRGAAANARTPARVAYPEILRCAEIRGTGLKVPVYAIEREAGVPLEDTEFWRQHHVDAYHGFLKIEDALNQVGHLSDDYVEREIDEAVEDRLPEAKDLGNALLRMARIGMITGDLHQGNIGIRQVSRPGWPKRGGMFVLDYGINVITRDDEKTLRQFKAIRANPLGLSLPDWPKIDV